jgi:hypothetical protein
MEVPNTPVRLELMGPSGDLWTAGTEEAKDMVTGLAEAEEYGPGNAGVIHLDAPVEAEEGGFRYLFSG